MVKDRRYGQKFENQHKGIFLQQKSTRLAIPLSVTDPLSRSREDIASLSDHCSKNLIVAISVSHNSNDLQGEFRMRQTNLLVKLFYFHIELCKNMDCVHRKMSW